MLEVVAFSMDTSKRMQRAATQSHRFPTGIGKRHAVDEHPRHQWYHSGLGTERPLDASGARSSPHESKRAAVIYAIAVQRDGWRAILAPGARAGESQLLGISD